MDVSLMTIVLLIIQGCKLCAGDSNSPNIAIIGGGIGGTSTAYFLNQLFRNEGNIDLFEKGNIGGRLATITFNKMQYEIGGTVIHPRNKYMLNFVNLLNLHKSSESCKSKLGIYDGEFVFTESSVPLFNYIKLLWRYGIGLIYLRTHINELLTRFERIYSLQHYGSTFENVRDLLFAMSNSYPDYLNISTQEGFSSAGFTESIVNEFILSTIRCNYGQSTAVHKFVGAVSVAGADPGLWAVKGGNKKVPEGLLHLSMAKHRSEKVESIDLTKNNQFNLTTNFTSRTYDIVILATPITNDHEKISFHGFEEQIQDFGKFHRTICTIVAGVLNKTYFGYEKSRDVPNIIMTASSKVFFNSLSQIYPVDGKVECYSKIKMWKIFSHHVFSETELDLLFLRHKLISVTDWLAYPEYNADKRSDRFILYKNLYYVNAIEWAASAMEMSAISAKNVALLAYNKWKQTNYVLTKNVLHTEL